MKSLLWILIFSAGPCFAQTGADVLLNQLGDKPKANAPAKAKTKKAKEQVAAIERPKMVPGDEFQKQLDFQIQNQKNLSFDVRQWSDLVLTGEFVKAAHLWTAIQMQIPASFRNEAEATQLYLLWKTGLNQTFFEQWIRNLASTSYADSHAEEVLETIVTPNLDAWLLKAPIVLNPKELTILDRLPAKKPFQLTLKAWSDMRRPKEASTILDKLPGDNKLTRFVAQTVVYNHIRSNDLKGAARIIKESIEPTIEASQDLEQLAKHDVSIARILYQAGQMNAAAQFYLKIPNQSTSYLPAHEELSWVYLRQGDMSKLRGEIKALANPVFKDRFQPEVYLLRAVSDLKMCFYDLLDKDLADFSKSNVIWAKRIDQAMNAKITPAPTIPDEYSQMAALTVKNLEAEMKRLSELGEQSIGATLPAVGWQKHWKDYLGQTQAALEEARKHQSDEYQRQWKNQRSALTEAIKKMRFVKVEYMSQVRQLSANSPDVDPKKLVASNGDSLPASTVVKSDNDDQLNFPATTEVWSDELFKLRSAAQAQCLKKAGVK